MSLIDEIELAKLEEAVEAAQKILAHNPGQGANFALSSELSSAQHRIEALETTGAVNSTEKERKESEKFQGLVVAYLVANEIHLSSSEQVQYGSFLSQAFFTKDNFEALDDFYESAYDRLSERGKAEMSHRVWEGVRQGEYQFSELPENTKEKEMERLYGLLTEPEKMPDNLKQIPESDRDEFKAAMEAGEADKAAQILNRESFRENVSTKEELKEAQKKEKNDKTPEAEQDALSETESKDIPLEEEMSPTEITSTQSKSDFSAFRA